MNDNDMIINDMDNFDFTQLEDVIAIPKEDVPPRGVTLDELTEDGGTVDDISDFDNTDSLIDPDGEDSTDIDVNPNDDTSDITEPEDKSEHIEIFNDLPEDVKLSFDGHEMTKSEVKQLFKDKETFDSQRELVSTAATSIDQIHRHIRSETLKHATAIDLNIQNLQRKMNSNISATEYGEYARQLQSAVEARSNLNKRVDEQMRLLDIERAETTRYRIADTDVKMKNEVPQWDSLKGSLLQDLQKRGVNLNDLEKVWSKDIAMMALNDYRYRMQKEKAGAAAMEAAKAKAPRSTSSAVNAKRQKAAEVQEAKKSNLLRKAKAGNLTDNDYSEMFNFLTD